MGTETGHCKSIPRGDADLAAERFRRLTNPLDQRLVARHDQRGADRDAAVGDGRPRQLIADVAVEPDGLRKHELTPAAQAPAVDELAVQHLFAHRRAAEHHDFAEQERGVFGQSRCRCA